jgi:hypothetical protein
LPFHSEEEFASLLECQKRTRYFENSKNGGYNSELLKISLLFPVPSVNANEQCVFSWTQAEWPKKWDVLNVEPLRGLASLEHSFKAVPCKDCLTFLKSKTQLRNEQNLKYRKAAQRCNDHQSEVRFHI